MLGRPQALQLVVRLGGLVTVTAAILAATIKL